MNEEKYCKGCGVKLQDENVLQEGYSVNLDQDYCQRCFRIKNYGDYQVVTKGNDEYQISTVYNKDFLNTP